MALNMSYCVNCGVELSPSEKSCPLCGVQVINPADPWKEPKIKPYPDRVDNIMKHINKKFSAMLAFTAMLIPVFVSLLCNLLINHTVSWSLYVIGGVACFDIYVLLPMLRNRQSPYLFILADFGVTVIYLLIIATLTNGMTWYTNLALPLTDAVFLSILYAAYIIRRKKLSLMLKLACLQLSPAIMCLSVDSLINFYLTGKITVFWSIIVFAVSLVFSLIFVLLHRRDAWLESLRKRLFI